MKKIVCVLLAIILAFCLVSCGEKNGEGENEKQESKDSNTIVLTKDNFEKYFKISEYMRICSEDDDIPYAKGIKWERITDYTYPYGSLTTSYCNGLRYKVTVTPISPYFVFNDVTVTIKVNGKIRGYDFDLVESSYIYDDEDSKKFDEACVGFIPYKLKITVPVDISGNGEHAENYHLVYDLGCSDGIYAQAWGSWSWWADDDYSYEIVDVTGTLNFVGQGTIPS